MSPSRASVAVLGSLLAFLVCVSAAAENSASMPQETFYVSLAGDDVTGDGSADNPWRTIGHAVGSIPVDGGVAILVGSGLYDGPILITRAFLNEVIVKSEDAYGAMLTNVRNNDAILSIILQAPNDGPVRITFEGFVFSNEGTSGGPCTIRAGHMIFISNVSNFTLRNNIIYGNNRMPRCNNMIKANIVGATQPWHDIRFEGNVFGNPPAVAADDLIDIFEPTEFDICDNIFYSDRGGSAGGSFVALRRQWGTASRSPRYHIFRNIFLSYEGGSDAAFLRIGGWGSPITDALVENNLMIGNSPTTMAAPVILEDASHVTLRANTIAGDMPSSAFAFRLGTDGDGPAPHEIYVYNNIFSDPTGSMGELVDVYGNGDIAAVAFNRNLYWNGNGEVPPTNDPAPIEADPLLQTDQSGMVPPAWNAAGRTFASGSRTVREEFERLVKAYGAIGAGSPACDSAAAGNMPLEDILGLERDSVPDIGAFERRGPTAVDPSLEGDASPEGIVILCSVPLDYGNIPFRLYRRTGDDEWLCIAPWLRGEGGIVRYVDSDVEAGIVYEYEIEGIGPSGPIGRWGPISIRASSPPSLGLRLLPNPTADAVTVSFVLPRPGDVKLRLVDATGRELGVKDLRGCRAGVHTLDESVRTWAGKIGSPLAVGTYWIRLETSIGTKSERWVILR